MFDYEKNPEEITRLSFKMIRQEVDFSQISNDIIPIALRMIHTSGMTDLLSDLMHSTDAGVIGKKAMQSGASILTDVKMVEKGISKKDMPNANKIICMLDTPIVAENPTRLKKTRTMMSLEANLPLLSGAIIAIGNAPTALFRLIELIAEYEVFPALVVATPPGFVGAAESKEALIKNKYQIPYITIRGRRGGSAMAAAAINALTNIESNK